MKRRKQLKKTLKCPDYIHCLPKRLADVLHQRTGERYSRFDAFRDLMERQAIQASDLSRSLADPIEVTITELSVDWGWHRHTVTAFLESLTTLGYLTVEKTVTCFRLLLTDLLIPDIHE